MAFPAVITEEARTRTYTHTYRHTHTHNPTPHPWREGEAVSNALSSSKSDIVGGNSVKYAKYVSSSVRITNVQTMVMQGVKKQAESTKLTPFGRALASEHACHHV